MAARTRKGLRPGATSGSTASEGRQDANTFVDRVATVGSRQAQGSRTQERRRKTRLEEVENRVTELELQLAAIGEALASPPQDPEEVLRLGDDYVEIQNELEALIREWESLHA